MSNDKRHNGTQGVSFSVVKKIYIGVAKEKVLIKLRQRTRAYTLDGKLFENANKTIRNTPKKKHSTAMSHRFVHETERKLQL